MNKKITGVTFLKKKKLWYARITFYGVRYSLGTHKSYEKAVEIYQAATKAGCIEVKAWCNTPVEYRGKLGEKLVGTSKFTDEESKIKKFSRIIDGSNDESHLSW